MLKTLQKVKKHLVASSLAVALGAGAVATSAQAADHNWRFANLYGRGTAFGEIYENLAKNIEDNTDGQIKVQVL